MYHVGTIRFPTVEENIVVSLVAREIFHVLLIGKLDGKICFVVLDLDGGEDLMRGTAGS